MSHQIVSREEWLRARTALLEQEKALTRQRALVAAERLRLPWVQVETNYVFDGRRAGSPCPISSKAAVSSTSSTS
jgi:predicted dithiol-disulfide oxidoreductase (DUF899 family)